MQLCILHLVPLLSYLTPAPVKRGGPVLVADLAMLVGYDSVGVG